MWSVRANKCEFVWSISHSLQPGTEISETGASRHPRWRLAPIPQRFSTQHDGTATARQLKIFFNPVATEQLSTGSVLAIVWRSRPGKCFFPQRSHNVDNVAAFPSFLSPWCFWNKADLGVCQHVFPRTPYCIPSLCRSTFLSNARCPPIGLIQLQLVLPCWSGNFAKRSDGVGHYHPVARKDGMADGVELWPVKRFARAWEKTVGGHLWRGFFSQLFCCLLLPCPLLAAISFLMHLVFFFKCRISASRDQQ